LVFMRHYAKNVLLRVNCSREREPDMMGSNKYQGVSHTNSKSISLVILTYNRPKLVIKQLQHHSNITYRPYEMIIVDNHSDEPVEPLAESYEFSRVIRMDSNIGIAGRNRGMSEASGEIIVTLDDDVCGLSDGDINKLITLFEDEKIGAVCFKVLNEKTKEIMNWCHHRRVELYSDKQFITEEITEGAVAFRKKALDMAGLYPEDFFISHEGPDLALRIMNSGYQVVYNPDIIVHHAYSPLGRANWRRYYYDTRNLVWLVLRNYPFYLGLKRLAVGLGAMMLYSIRDEFFRYWLKAIYDAIKGSRYVISQRNPMNEHTRSLLKEISQYRPGIIYLLRKRLLKREVKI